MRKAILIVALLSIVISSSLVGAQTPPVVETLGPAVFYYYSPNNMIIIYNPTNEVTYQNPVALNFSVAATGLFGQFGNIGYSLDGGNITSVNDFINKTVDENPTDAPAWYIYNTTAFASVVLPSLSEGVHNVTVYYGWQYLGIPNNPSLERFEVFSYATLNFTVAEKNNSLPTTTLTVVTSITLVAVVATIVLLYIMKKNRVKTISTSNQSFL